MNLASCTFLRLAVSRVSHDAVTDLFHISLFPCPSVSAGSRLGSRRAGPESACILNTDRACQMVFPAGSTGVPAPSKTVRDGPVGRSLPSLHVFTLNVVSHPFPSLSAVPVSSSAQPAYFLVGYLLLLLKIDFKTLCRLRNWTHGLGCMLEVLFPNRSLVHLTM